MKRLFVLIFAAVALAACSKDGGENPNDPVMLFDADPNEFIAYGRTVDYEARVEWIDDVSITKPAGWDVSLVDTELSITAPAESAFASGAESSGEIRFTPYVGNVAGNTLVINVRTGILVDFEDTRAEDYLAGPTTYGENLYANSEEQYFGYDDQASGLMMMINESYGAYNYYNGGVAVSRWTDMESDSYLNQCSVYYKDATTGRGGHKGSSTFAVATGYLDPSYGDSRPEIYFIDDQQESVFDHMWVTNSTFAALTMMEGGSMGGEPFGTGDWFLLTVTGIDKDGVKTGDVEFYLADLRTASSKGIVKQWTRVDLSSLGEVNKLLFSLTSSDNNQTGSMNTPGYFCFDDVAIRR